MILLQPSPAPDVLYWHYSYKALMSSILLWSGREGRGREAERQVSSMCKGTLEHEKGGLTHPPNQPLVWGGQLTQGPQPSLRGWPVWKEVLSEGYCMAPAAPSLKYTSLSWKVKVTNISVVITLPGSLADQQREWDTSPAGKQAELPRECSRPP